MPTTETRIPIKLSNGAIIHAAILAPNGEQEASHRMMDFSEITQALAGIAEDVNRALENAAPAKVTLELGVELAIEAGRLTAMLVSGSGKSTIKLTLEWHR
jgi:hypothetical protein